MRRSLFYILLLTFISVSSVHAATTFHYFANSGSDSNTPCTNSGSPCKTLDKAQNIIDSKSSSDVVYLYFKRGDTWSMDTSAVALTTTYGLTVANRNPKVNIDAYGSGNKPVFDGMVPDFNDPGVHPHNATTGPFFWNKVFQINRNHCSIKNVKIANVYGSAVCLGSVNDPADYFTFEGNEVSNFGYSGVYPSMNYGTRYSTYTKNLIHDGGQLYKVGLSGFPNWGIGLSTVTWPATNRTALGNEVSYNVVYNISGEGIHGNGYTAEYNIIGDTGSVGIYLYGATNDMVSTIARYNFVVMSDHSSSEYFNLPKISPDGIYITDELAGGDNTGATIQVYGNIVINRWMGIAFNDFANDSQMGEVRIYNNTLIDNHKYNIYIGNYDKVQAGGGYIYNNASILYDQTSLTHVLDQDNPADLSSYWTIDHNAFWTTGCAGNPTVDDDWKTYWVHNDPKLAGEEQGSPVAWTGQSGSTYYKDITFSNVLPNSDSALINAGKTLGAGYETKFLTYGTDFSKLPFVPTFQRASQSDLPEWSIGAIVRGGGKSQGFVDVPSGYWAEQDIYKIYNAGITQGYSQNPLMYRPDDLAIRAQMATFLGRAIYGSSFTPTSATGIFEDVPVNYLAADWIEKFYNDGITDGCSTNPLQYCPDDDVTRAQIAIFLLKAKHGSSYAPPAARGIFTDVPANYWAADWIEQLYNEGLTIGCSSNPLIYCPDDPVTRAQMAVFTVRTFGL
jgi:S-layer homology domain